MGRGRKVEPLSRPGGNRVLVANRQRKVPLDRERARGVAAYVLERMGRGGAELSVTYVSDRSICGLNRRYLRREGPTDVLAFSQREGEGCRFHTELLGDVIISAETADFQAEERGTSLQQELDLLLIHGILHLLGYDHTGGREEARRMARVQAGLLKRVGEHFAETGMKG